MKSFKIILFLISIILTACINDYHENTNEQNRYGNENHLSTTVDTIIQHVQKPTPIKVKFGSEWTGSWMNEKYKVLAKEQGDFFHYFRGVVLNISDDGVGHNLSESVAYPIDTNYTKDGYQLKDIPPYYLSDYLLDYIDSERFSKKLKDNRLSKIAKGYKVYLHLEKLGDKKVLTITMYVGAEKKVEKFIPYESVNSLIAGNYIDNKGKAANFSFDGNCNWGVYKSYEVALSEEIVIIYLRKFPLQKEITEIFFDPELVDLFILEQDSAQRLRLFNIIGSDNFSADQLDIAYVFGYPSAVINPKKGVLFNELTPNR